MNETVYSNPIIHCNACWADDQHWTCVDSRQI